MTGAAAGQSADSWDEILSVNVNAVFRCVRAALAHMQARKRGDINVTSSIAGHEVLPMEPAYSASKHAINAFVYVAPRASVQAIISEVTHAAVQ